MKQARVGSEFELIPSHVWRFHVRREVLGLAIKDSQARSLWGFLAVRKHPLHPYADAQKGSASANCSRNCILHSRAAQVVGSREMTYTGQNDTSCCRDTRGVGSDGALLPQPVERLL